jgi:hypothetical protein
LNTAFRQKETGQDFGHAHVPAPRVDDDKDKHAVNDGVENGDNKSKEVTTALVRT